MQTIPAIKRPANHQPAPQPRWRPANGRKSPPQCASTRTPASLCPGCHPRAAGRRRTPRTRARWAPGGGRGCEVSRPAAVGALRSRSWGPRGCTAYNKPFQRLARGPGPLGAGPGVFAPCRVRRPPPRPPRARTDACGGRGPRPAAPGPGCSTRSARALSVRATRGSAQPRASRPIPAPTPPPRLPPRPPVLRRTTSRPRSSRSSRLSRIGSSCRPSARSGSTSSSSTSRASWRRSASPRWRWRSPARRPRLSSEVAASQGAMRPAARRRQRLRPLAPSGAQPPDPARLCAATC